MNDIYKKLLLSMSFAFLSACGGDDNSGGGDDNGPEPIETIPLNNIANPVVFTQNYTKDTILDSVSSQQKQLLYKMLGVDGVETIASTLVFVPTAAAPTGGYKIVVWAHGTTGVGDGCAPSVQGLGATASVVQALLNAGYVVVAPDYEGLGTAGSHPFLNLKSEAFSITDAVVAARDYLSKQGLQVSTQWATVGHSQGGHAALGAAQYAERAQLDYKGTIAFAPASNLHTILQAGEAQAGTNSILQKLYYPALDAFTTLAVAGMQGHNISVDYSQVFKTELASVAPKAESECLAPLIGLLEQNMQDHLDESNPNFSNYGRLQDNFADIPAIKKFLEQDSQPLLVPITTPIYIYQGTADLTVPKFVTDILVNTAGSSSTIDYKTDTDTSISPKWSHTTVVTANVTSMLSDLNSFIPAQ
ncbi:alpha/beta fold hydrolase [Acinetobacter sp. 194]|uniref:alpha/beta hydrolase n=1 Tax=Acinetobacter shaoyimingii TaxID=2715164 RepID=UPI00140DC59F|nr:alpha/beta fold hydrolase [Acinetobacter shaoyimingii]NHB57788.1 alpha/beta fold hydrolase [Acinetobacter shaoyimingii]